MTDFGKRSTAEEVTQGLDLSGRTYLVTGANSGLGLETVRVLQLRGARVLGTGRTREKVQEACPTAVPLACELAEPASVRACVAAVEEKLDGIICNAGIMALPKLEQAHGYELQFFTNHIGHFILVMGLLDRLTDKGRVVMVSSRAHTRAPAEGIQFDNLSGAREYSPWKAYGQSKLANLLFARELARRLPAGQTANALHPGVIATNLGRNMPWVARTVLKALSPFLLKTVPQGAATQSWAVTHPSLDQVTGRYFADCAEAVCSQPGGDLALASRLFEETERIVAGLAG